MPINRGVNFCAQPGRFKASQLGIMINIYFMPGPGCGKQLPSYLINIKKLLPYSRYQFLNIYILINGIYFVFNSKNTK